MTLPSTGTILIQDTGTDFSVQLEMQKENTPRIRFDDTRVDVAPPSGTNLAAEWDLGMDGSQNFLMRSIAQNSNVFVLQDDGDLTILGTLTENSDKNNKMAIEPLDTSEVLAKVTELPLSSWTYKHDADEGIRHIGPMAQDFYALFGTGASETGISTIDTSGVALAAIQALEAQNAVLTDRVAELEALVAKLVE